MTALVETKAYPTTITQIELTDPVQGGLNGVDNVPHIQLGNRTAYLASQVALTQFKTCF